MLEGKPQWFWYAMAGIALLAVMMVANDMWTPMNQVMLFIGVFVILAATSGTGERQKIYPEEADRLALAEAQRRSRMPNSGFRGPFRIIAQMKKNYELTDYTDRTIAIETSGDDRKIMLVKIPLYKDRNGKIDINEVTLVNEWSTKDDPNIEILKPDSMMDFLRLEKKARNKIEEEAGIR